jgi:purine nucleoside phosphorylase
MPEKKGEPPAIGIIGGSGLYQIEELRDTNELNIDTPFGPSSDAFVCAARCVVAFAVL